MTQPWQNRIVTTEPSDVDPMTLRGHAKNIRTHASAQRRLLEAALDELGHVGKIVVSARTRRVLNGHLRVELAIGRDAPTIPVTWIDVDEDEELIVLAFFDQIGEGAEIDAAKLKSTLSQVKAGSESLHTMLADWAASYQVTIVPAKPTLIAPPAPIVTPAAPVRVAETVAAAPSAAARIAAPSDMAGSESTVQPGSFAAGEATSEAAVWSPAPVEALPVAEALPERGAPELENPNSALDEMSFSADENPFADMFATALVEDRQVVRDEPVTKAPKAERPAPTTTPITIGEYTQTVAIASFAPWFAALVAQCDNDGQKLATEIKRRLGFGA
jgi:hypothetical protein